MNEKFAALAQDNKAAEAVALYRGDMRQGFNKFLSDLNDDEAYQVKQAQKAKAEGAEAYSGARTLIMVALGFAATLCVIAGWMIVSGVSTPIRAMTGAMTRLAQHDLTTQINGVGRKDEVGQMASAVEVFKTSMIEGDRLKAEQEEAQRLAAKRSALVDQLTKDFDVKVQGVVQGVASQASQMEASAQSMSAAAEEATKQAGAVAAASEEGAANVQTVASAAEELSSSIAEIGRQVSHSSQIAANAVGEAAKANDMVQGLLNASQKIGEIVALINEIADQTNLLALECHHRGGTGGRSRQGLCGRRRRSEEPGDPDLQGHRGDRRPDHQRAGRHPERGERHRLHRQDDRRDRPDRHHHRRRGGRARCRHPGDRPQCRRSRQGHPGSLVQYRRRHPGRQLHRRRRQPGSERAPALSRISPASFARWSSHSSPR